MQSGEKIDLVYLEKSEAFKELHRTTIRDPVTDVRELTPTFLLTSYKKKPRGYAVVLWVSSSGKGNCKGKKEFEEQAFRFISFVLWGTF